MIDTLIVWTESNGTDMALSFQEADGCAAIWWVGPLSSQPTLMSNIKFKLTCHVIGSSFLKYSRIYLPCLVSDQTFLRDADLAESMLITALPRLDDALSDDAMDGFPNPLVLPPAELKNLDDVEGAMRQAVSTQPGRDALSKFVISEDYIRKLIPLVEMAEDLESIEDLHHLCNIMKMLILLNDNQIIEHVVSDGVVDGVVGALECELSV